MQCASESIGRVDSVQSSCLMRISRSEAMSGTPCRRGVGSKQFRGIIPDRKGVNMPTEEEKQRELKRVTKTGGFRAGIHDFLAETNFEKLKKRNDRWEADHRNQSLADRKMEEFL